jgi:(E)-4-hydroxy-3-methylbut-2-enyl-diphosphate synthase
MNKRDTVKKIKAGSVEIGGGAPVSVQTMCNTKTWDVDATVAQIKAMQTAGADIVRIALPDMESAKAVSAIKEQVSVPLVADIHFDYRLALEAAERGIDKIRINPGNIGAPENVRAVAEACRRHNIPIRIGVNAGSLEKGLLEKYGHPCPEALVESAKGHAELLERYDFDDICISMKSSSVPLTIAAYRLAAETFDYPLHLGVTETGTEWNGTIQSAVGIGTLLCEGIGNTIRVSLTADPVKEVSAGIAIVKAAGLRPGGVRFVSCPTCGRTEIDLISLATEVEKRVGKLDRDITVAVMGCIVNGPGEAREADYGIAGGKGKGLLFKKGQVLGTYPYEELCDRLLDLINSDGTDGKA